MWIPIDFHMIQDLKDRSVPIVNNDYRYGVMFKAQYALAATRWLSARLHVGHESTHLGDDYSIVGERKFPTTFERINVSWEYADLGLLYERVDGETFSSLRAGVTANLRGSYYDTGPDSITVSAKRDGRSVARSEGLVPGWRSETAARNRKLGRITRQRSCDGARYTTTTAFRAASRKTTAPQSTSLSARRSMARTRRRPSSVFIVGSIRTDNSAIKRTTRRWGSA